MCVCGVSFVGFLCCSLLVLFLGFSFFFSEGCEDLFKVTVAKLGGEWINNNSCTILMR